MAPCLPLASILGLSVALRDLTAWQGRAYMRLFKYPSSIPLLRECFALKRAPRSQASACELVGSVLHAAKGETLAGMRCNHAAGPHRSRQASLRVERHRVVHAPCRRAEYNSATFCTKSPLSLFLSTLTMSHAGSRDAHSMPVEHVCATRLPAGAAVVFGLFALRCFQEARWTRATHRQHLGCRDDA